VWRSRDLSALGPGYGLHSRAYFKAVVLYSLPWNAMPRKGAAKPQSRLTPLPDSRLPSPAEVFS
jgi:hypothetical protein